MKQIVAKLLLVIAFVHTSPRILYAQQTEITGTGLIVLSKKSASDPMPALKPAKALRRHILKKNDKTNRATISLDLDWDESFVPFIVAVDNDTKAPLKVLGVQTTSGLFVTDIPKVIPTDDTADFGVIYSARSGSGQADFLRILTDRGERAIEVAHERQKVVEFDTTSLEWTQGRTASTKSVTLSVVPNTTIPKNVLALGMGNSATLEDLGGGKYRINVTPGSTDKAQEFPVIITFDQNAPGVVTTISGSVRP